MAASSANARIHVEHRQAGPGCRADLAHAPDDGGADAKPALASGARQEGDGNRHLLGRQAREQRREAGNLVEAAADGADGGRGGDGIGERSHG